jgi:excinuclease ABC subunit C
MTILPNTPGVYQYFDTEERLLYIGKAKSLKNRVRSYFRFTPEFKANPTLSPRILKMLQEAKSLDYIIVESEEDALILENSLIKQLKPKYNILLRDDKTYPYIYIDEKDPFPRFELTRKVLKGKSITYYGPFPNGGRALLDSLYELFPLVQKKNCLREGKACLFYQIKRCLAPCEGKITSQEYGTIIDEAKEAIVKRRKLTSALESRMLWLAENERFEEAAKIRDMAEAIKSLTLTSPVDLAKDTDLDIFAILNGDERGVVVKLFMRGGRIISSTFSYFRHTHIFDENEAYKQALLEYYGADLPQLSGTILVAHAFSESQEIAATLSRRFGKKIKLVTPLRGPKAKLVSLALQNAHELLRQQKSDNRTEQQIADLFTLSTIPYRVETFDNSHLMGAATVGAMVVWDEEKWDKNSYRRYELHERDEYGQMRETLIRRVESFEKNPAPDLWVIDGGATLLKLAHDICESVGVFIDMVAIAKEKVDAKAHRAKGSAKDIMYCKDEEGIVQTYKLQTSDKRLQFIQRQRDESHRFVINFHKKQKRTQDKQISLLQIKGIGEAKVKKMLLYFGTFEEIKNASLENLKEVLNEKDSMLIIEHFKTKDTD